MKLWIVFLFLFFCTRSVSAADYIDIIDPDNSAGTNYTSLAAWEANAEIDHGAGVGDTLTARCFSSGGTADTTAVTISGNSVDSITIEGLDFPSDGIFNTSLYRLGNALAGDKFVVNDLIPLTINNLQFYDAYTGASAPSTIYLNIAAVLSIEINFNSLIIKSTAVAAGSKRGLQVSNNANVTLTAKNITIEGYYYNNLSLSASIVNIYNSTVSAGHFGIYQANTAVVTVKNNAIFNNVDDFFGTITIDYCASDDGNGTNAVDISPGGVEADDWNAAFTDYVNGDFSIKDMDSVLYNTGTDLSGVNVVSDILGSIRPRVLIYDIGAYELFKPGFKYDSFMRSIFNVYGVWP